MPQTYQLNQRAVNLMIATMPITLAILWDSLPTIPNLAFHSDARNAEDILLDSYPSYHDTNPDTTRSSSKAEPKPNHYYHPLHADILDYLTYDQRVTNTQEITTLFGINREDAANRLYELIALGKLRKLPHRHGNSDNIYTLAERQLTIADIPNGKRNDHILELRAKGYSYATLSDYFKLSSDIITRTCQSWSHKRRALLAPPASN